MTDTAIHYSTANGIGRIVLNRPKSLNALTRQMMIELAGATRQAIADADVRVICISGNGRGFCAGQDLTERDPRKVKHPLDLEAIQIELFHRVITMLAETPKPVVASVAGVAAGAGAGLALAADITIAAASANFAFSFSKVGLSVDTGVGFALTKRLGPARARAILMLGESIPAANAADLGLIWKCVADDDLEPETEKLLLKLVAAPALALSGIKGAIAAVSSGLDYRACLEAEAHLQGLAGAHPDYAEGVLAFLEKRQPGFRAGGG